VTRGVLCLALVSMLSCAGRCGAARADHDAPRDDDDPIPLDPAESGDADPLGPARCKERRPLGRPVQLVGSAVPSNSGLLVSVVVQSPPALAVWTLPEGPTTILRSDPADAPPAALASEGDLAVAAFFGPAGKKEQSVEVVQLGGGPLFRLTRAPEESLAVDVALVAGTSHVLWHEEGELVVRGAQSRLVLSAPPRAVLESPRLLANRGSLFAFAIARTWDTADAGARSGPQTTWEGAGEPRSTTQLVAYAIEPNGEKASAPVSLTPARGHVDAFDVARTNEAPGFVVFVHDAAQTDARGGGSLLRIRWNGAGDPARMVFRGADVGGGPLAWSALDPSAPRRGGIAALLSYGTTAGEAVLVRLGLDASEQGRASREPSLDDARIVGSTASRGLLIASSNELAWLACDEGAP